MCNWQEGLIGLSPLLEMRTAPLSMLPAGVMMLSPFPLTTIPFIPIQTEWSLPLTGAAIPWPFIPMDTPKSRLTCRYAYLF